MAARAPEAEVQRELGLVQVLGRLVLWSGILSVAGLSGWLAQIYSYETVFLLGLAVPATSLTGAMLVRLDGAGRRSPSIGAYSVAASCSAPWSSPSA